jgi:hypothetical protein
MKKLDEKELKKLDEILRRQKRRDWIKKVLKGVWNIIFGLGAILLFMGIIYGFILGIWFIEDRISTSDDEEKIKEQQTIINEPIPSREEMNEMLRDMYSEMFKDKSREELIDMREMYKQIMLEKKQEYDEELERDKIYLQVIDEVLNETAKQGGG